MMAADDDERELRREREWLRITLGSIGDAVISTDVEGRVTFLNSVAEVLTGWPVAEAMGRPLAEVFHIVHEHTRAPAENPALRALREGVVVGLANHTVLIARDGRERPIDDSAAPIRDENDALVGVVLVFRDVSERKQAEVVQARLAAIVESSEDAIVSKTLDGVIRSWNASAERLFGYTAAEAVGRSVTLIIPAELVAEEQAILARLVRGERITSFETIRVAKDGRRLDISLTVSPIRDAAGRIIGASKIARDITELKRAERALRASEGRHRFLAELAAATQPLVDPADVMATTARLLAEYLDVDRCAYAEIEDERTYVITGDHTRGVASIVGRWPLAAFGAEHVRSMRAQEAYVIADVDVDPRAGAALEAYRATNTRAVICVPLHKQGRLTAAIAVHQKIPRAWSPEDVALVETVGARCWEALERARVARTLRDSEARYRAIVESTPECVKLVSPDGTLLQMNAAGLVMIEADSDAVIGANVYDIVAPEHRAAFMAFNAEVCSGATRTLEFEILGRRGTRRRMESTAVPLRTPDGRYNHLAVSRDITERAAAERTLAASRARLDYAVRLSGLGFWYCDLPLREQNWDERVREHFWRPSGPITMATFYACIHPEDREEVRQAIEASIRDASPYDIDFRTVEPGTGAIKWIRCLGGLGEAPDGTPVRFDGVSVDVTARKHSAERLARALDLAHAQGRLLRRVADASLTIHSAGTLESILGVVAEEARLSIGAALAFSSLTINDEHAQGLVTAVMADDHFHASAPYVLPDVGDAALEVCRTNRPGRMTRAQLAERAGWSASEEADDRRPRSGWLAAAFVGQGGKNLGLLQLCDKLAGEFTESDEAVLVQLAHIASVAIENARLYTALQEQDRRKDEFLAVLAHELRNPLAPIRNGLEVIRMTDNPAIRRRSQDMMHRQLGHMVRLIDDLLDISRISRNRVELQRARVQLADVIRSAVETARPLMEAAMHRLEVELPDAPIVLDADMTRLAQVFSNLLTNSAKYTESGGSIRLVARCDEDFVTVTVVDDGIGIPAAALPTIFEMFSQVDGSMERSRGGLGIGLALVKGLVEMHGGTVAAESAGPGRGSAFSVRLPVVARPDEASDAAASSSSSSGRRRAAPGRRILVVDDNRDVAMTMATMLELLGDEVFLAHDGLAAISAAETHRPDAILMDVGMPLLNGYDATRRIREQPWGQTMPIVALTGWGQENDRARSRDAGCSGHLVKPVSLHDLEVMLAELLR